MLRSLPSLEFETAINPIEIIAAMTEDTQMYDQRDYEWALSCAREEGLEKGRDQGLKTGVMTGKIQLFQELSGEPPSSRESLAALSSDHLSVTLAELQQRLRDRPI